jgi:hypothetical protein
MTTAASLQEIYQKDSVPALAAVRGSLHDISGLIDIQVEKQENQLHEIESKTKRNILLLTGIAVISGAGVSFMEKDQVWFYRSPSKQDLDRALDEIGEEPLC